MAAERTARQQAVYHLLLRFGAQPWDGILKGNVPADRLPEGLVAVLPARESTATRTLEELVERGDVHRGDGDPPRYAAVREITRRR